MCMKAVIAINLFAVLGAQAGGVTQKHCGEATMAAKRYVSEAQREDDNNPYMKRYHYFCSIASNPPPKIGMDKLAVYAPLSAIGDWVGAGTNWGPPARTSKTTSALGTTEYWYFDLDKNGFRGTLVFRNDKLAVIEE
jgi:hypothetical protein